LKSDLTPSSITLHQNRLLFFTGQEKAAIMGWNPAKLDSADLTARELGLALGNAWALPVSMRLVKQLNECMGWQS
jgi:dissimilatory sulfite reductase (desulfoviridin) alpha/beta subunit